MELSPNTIKPAHGAKQNKMKRGGRGNASGKGTTAGRGGKGQTARSGGAHRTQMRGMRHLILKIPKVRGTGGVKIEKQVVTLRDLNRVAIEGREVTPKFLESRGVVGHPERGIKIVASGEVTKKISVKGCLASKKAVELIEKAGGKVTY